jgi:hypothetical protein
MSNIKVMIRLVLLSMAVADVCRKSPGPGVATVFEDRTPARVLPFWQRSV